jgi:hypothetical protein
MSSTIILQRGKQVGPVPAIGVHAELLGEISQTASALIKLVELERSGIYDGFGHNFWVGSDSVLTTARKLVALAEQRIAELRDAAPR